MKVVVSVRRFIARASLCAMFLLPIFSSAQTAPVQPAPVLGKPTPADEDAAMAIYRAFFDDPRVVSAFTMVNVTNGVATLSGSVQDKRARMIAEDIASRAAGITRVVNNLEVGPPPPAHSDEEIYNNIRRSIAADPQANRYKILVGVVNGRVYLAGPVDTVLARTKIANIAGTVPGVVSVENGLTVAEETAYDPPLYPHFKHPSDAEVKKQILQQMAGSPMIEPNQIDVKVKHGVATLTGKVTTEVERDAVIHSAYVGGAKEVRNNIQVVAPPPETTTLAPTGRINK